MITFKEDTHEYFNGDKKLISVTQLMRKHGLAPNYDGIPDAVLRAKAERGTLIHKEIESFITKGEIGFTTELIAFKDYLMVRAGGVIGLLSETILHNDICAGTADLIFCENGANTVADIKTTATIHKEAVSWQLSIYAKLASDMRLFKIERGQVFHFDNDGNLKVVDIPLKPVEEVERLFDCERKGEIYKQELAEVDDKVLSKLITLESYIKSIEEQKKVAEEQAIELRAALMAAMEKTGTQIFENEHIKLTYIAPTTRTAIDSARLKKEMPEIAEQYSKTSQVKASLRITLKEANDE